MFYNSCVLDALAAMAGNVPRHPMGAIQRYDDLKSIAALEQIGNYYSQ